MSVSDEYSPFFVGEPIVSVKPVENDRSMDEEIASRPPFFESLHPESWSYGNPDGITTPDGLVSDGILKLFIPRAGHQFWDSKYDHSSACSRCGWWVMTADLID